LQKRLKTYENFSKIQKNIKQQLKKNPRIQKGILKKTQKEQEQTEQIPQSQTKIKIFKKKRKK
jgi:hypothetical protein